MILIVSVSYDDSTANVIDWIVYYEKKFQRINYGNENKIKIELSDDLESIFFSSNKIKISLDKIKSYWYRRGNFNFKPEYFSKHNNVTSSLNDHFNSETTFLKSFLNQFLKENINSINNYEDTVLNKLTVLMKAKRFGISIPETLVTENKSDVLAFLKKNDPIITKPIREGFSFIYKKTNYYLHTILLTLKDVKEFPEKFNYLLFQKFLNKKYELRIFYLDGKFYSSAIFSQNDDSTKVDFRNYNNENPNRVVPYLLPKKMEYKLTLLMDDLKIRSGSIDMVLTKENKYVFLEVNPIGQFTQVSKPCNYNLEKQIALSLINENT